MDDWNEIILYIQYEKPLKDLCFLSAIVFRLLGWQDQERRSWRSPSLCVPLVRPVSNCSCTWNGLDSRLFIVFFNTFAFFLHWRSDVSCLCQVGPVTQRPANQTQPVVQCRGQSPPQSYTSKLKPCVFIQFLAVLSVGSLNTPSPSWGPESFYGRRDTQHLPPKRKLKRRLVRSDRSHLTHLLFTCRSWNNYALFLTLPLF